MDVQWNGHTMKGSHKKIPTECCNGQPVKWFENGVVTGCAMKWLENKMIEQLNTYLYDAMVRKRNVYTMK